MCNDNIEKNIFTAFRRCEVAKSVKPHQLFQEGAVTAFMKINQLLNEQ